jgi:hypothetical protein
MPGRPVETNPDNVMIEKAKELARSGDYLFVYQIERALQATGFHDIARVFRRQPHAKKELRDLLLAANTD